MSVEPKTSKKCAERGIFSAFVTFLSQIQRFGPLCKCVAQYFVIFLKNCPTVRTVQN